MKLLDLLELALKSDEVIDVLEHYELQVMYDFDRLHENTADAYWAASTEAGFQLRFDEKQVLDTIFMYAQSRGKFSAIDRSVAGIPFYSSFAEASAAFRERDNRDRKFILGAVLAFVAQTTVAAERDESAARE